jgi:MoxR-like ATPase
MRGAMTDTLSTDSRPHTTAEQAAAYARAHDAVLANVEQVIQGKHEVVRLALTCLFAGGHLLIEDVPGVGKTSLAKALADSIDASCNRIQFTPDLLPSDITGVAVWNQDSHRFEFRPGAVFANLVVGDEINRASPKTQSALLEVMEEQQVTIDAVRHWVPQPFMVVATQNPIDLEGTYRLPEAQLDRFLLRIAVGYPDDRAEEEILTRRAATGMRLGQVRPVISLDQVRTMIELTAGIQVAPAIARYVVAVAKATRGRPELRLGVSPRGSLALLRAAQASAAADGRNYVVPDDVKTVAPAVLTHRLLLTAEAEIRGDHPDAVLADVLAGVPVPTAANGR